MQYEDDFGGQGEKKWWWVLGVIMFAIVMGAVGAGLLVIWTHREDAALSTPMVDAGEVR